MGRDRRDLLRFGPPFVYPAKAFLTRARSASWLATGRGRNVRGLRILFLHRVADDGDELAVPTGRFALQMATIERAGFRVVDVDSAFRALAHEQEARVVGLSFDDGFRDVAEHALPVLE